MMKNMDNKRTIEMCRHDAIYGLAIGDALGVPYEFMSRGSFCCTGMTGYGTHSQPAGTWSDDTSMTIATVRSIIDTRGGIDIDDIRNNFIRWEADAEFTVDHELFDIGIATGSALRTGRPCTGEHDNGNGSLMRILPLAFTDCTDEEIRAVSAITHGHEISMQACVIYIHIARRLLEGETIEAIIPTLKYDKPFDRLCRIDQLSEDEIRSGGYVVDTLEASLWAIAKAKDYQEAVLTAINLGRDTDTTGAVTGGLAGIVYGLESEFAANCMDQLRGRAVIEECLWDEEEQVKHFHGKKCCTFSRKCSRTSFQIGLKLIKRYEGTETAWHADHIDRSLWQCTYCGAYFVLEETEQIAWGGGDDTYKDDYYQVDSEEHADRLVSRYGSLFAVYDGPMRAWG